MWTPLIYTGILLVVFIVYVQFCLYEERRGHRVVLGSFRGWLDRVIDKITSTIEKAVRYVIRYIITLSWYYSLHAFLMLLLKSLAGVYHMVEAVLIRNRDRARELRRERKKHTSNNHLEQIAEHKAEVKLTEAEKKKRKDKALKG